MADQALNPLSDKLVTELDLYSPVLTQEQLVAAEEIMNELETMLRSLVETLGVQGDTGQLLLLGGNHLGMLLTQDEMDAVYIVPVAIQLRDFMMQLRMVLEQCQEASGISSITPEGQLNAPGFRFTFRNRNVMMLLSQNILGLPTPTSTVVVANTAGLLAHEVTKKLLSVVPNVEQFRLLLRFVKFWAKQRGIYGTGLGFFGGVAWAICCAHVCQLFPDLELASLAQGFFTVLSRWDWKYPVTLHGQDPLASMQPPSGDVNGGVPVPADAPRPPSGFAPAVRTEVQQSASSTAPAPREPSEVVPAMWVEFPVGNGLSATPYISQTTAKIIQKELRRGHKRLKQVETGRGHWTDVFGYARFFQRHHHYLQCDFYASDEAVFASWFAFGKQQMQSLVHHFEAMNHQRITLRPWPEWITFKDAEWPYARAVFVGLQLKKNEKTQEGEKPSYDLREPIVKIIDSMNQWPDADKYNNQFDFVIRHVRLAEVEQWMDLCRKGLVVNANLHKGDPIM